MFKIKTFAKPLWFILKSFILLITNNLSRLRNAQRFSLNINYQILYYPYAERTEVGEYRCHK